MHVVEQISQQVGVLRVDGVAVISGNPALAHRDKVGRDPIPRDALDALVPRPGRRLVISLDLRLRLETGQRLVRLRR
eukprot:3821172-Pyramimonas_sp.AAC.1